ncbi:MAG: hypothetical protein QOE99_47 [Actinomycetota bacterium]|jgi:hypothetical protein|nr:hypothetical protein [Actinomycetota bacterium]
METDRSYEQVPDVEADSVPDPHWLTLRYGSGLPEAYMAPTMGGKQPARLRLVAGLMLSIFLMATIQGICLTYGLPG